jgi:hypothetical protein
MKKEVVLGSLLLMLGACGPTARFEAVQPMTCVIQDDQIVCPDGSSTPVPKDGIDGSDGTDGIDGIDGRDGSLIEIVDPCGDGPGVDEILIKLDDGSFLAWYQDLGLTILAENTQYRTTDNQRCKFEIVNGEVFEL